ncbi:MAG TPA: hypothetical protein VGE98_13890, partial [Thermoanaerobaculia bacterium]
MKRALTLTLCATLLLTLTATRLAVAKGGDKSSKPRIAVLAFKSKADNQWWYSHGAEAAQDVFVTELV